jgi:hypothetical protein
MKRQRSFLSIDNFDPLEVDISFLDEVTDTFPVQGAMDGPMAEQFATATLMAADRCTDLLAQSIVFLGHCDTAKRSAKARAIRDSLNNKVPSTVAKDVSSDGIDFVEAENKYNVALAWNTWLQSKNDALIKMHHLCKDFLKNSEMTKGISGWHPQDAPTRARYQAEEEDESVPFEAPKKSSPWKV